MTVGLYNFTLGSLSNSFINTNKPECWLVKSSPCASLAQQELLFTVFNQRWYWRHYTAENETLHRAIESRN